MISPPWVEEYRLCAIVTILLHGLNVRSGIAVGMARQKYNIPLPKLTGPVEFERIVRAHANNAEQYPSFLALMWVCAFFVHANLAGVLGLVWLWFRHNYVTAYHASGENLGSYTVPSYFVLIFYAASTFAVIVYDTFIAGYF